MEIAERLEWFMKMLRCKYPVDLQEYDRSLTPHGNLADDRIRMLHKLLAGGGWLEQMRVMMKEPGVDMVLIGGNVGLLWGAVCLREMMCRHAILFWDLLWVWISTCMIWKMNCRSF